MNIRANRRGHTERFLPCQHWKLNDLKRLVRDNSYLAKENIPTYPRPEFHVSHLKHDTTEDGVRGIWADKGFKSTAHGDNSMLWWSLYVAPDDIQAAEQRLLEQAFPNRTEEQAQRQNSFLGKFSTSPILQDWSMYGPYRFTFPLEEILKAYSEQFCSGAQPVMRVYETILYKQQVVYAVLVHSPDSEAQFSQYPLLTDDGNSVCAYRDGHFIWRSEAMCETHSYELVERRDENLMEARKVTQSHKIEFYVWDHVAIALHVNDQVLKFDAEKLKQNFKTCSVGPVTVDRNR